MSLPQDLDLRSEQSIKKDTLSALIHLGILAWDNRSNTIGRRRRGTSNKGTADILGVLRGGRLLAVEVKRPGAPPRANEAAQKEWLAKADALGAVVIERAESVGMVLERLRAEGYISG
ncbi:MAG TPA: hypothetical protein DCY13_04880 [Verrucomicrobiales bacterium]|nr:hypothetical protein [Verrucomicrobiales bacterium]